MPESISTEGWYIKMVGTNRIWTTRRNTKGRYVPVIFDTCAIAQHHIGQYIDDKKERERLLCKCLAWNEYEPIEIKEYIKKYGVVAGSGFIK